MARAVGDRGRSLAPVRVVSLSLFFCAAAVLAGLALSAGRMASAQAPDQAYWLPADSAVDGACPPPSGGADYWVRPDSEVGLLPILCPPEGDAMLMGGGQKPTLTFIHPGGEGNEFPVLCPLCKPPEYRGEWLWAFGQPYGTGTYHWQCDPEETLCEALCESTVAGMGQTTIASYTWNGQTSDPVTSGYIHVFDADLTLAGGSADPQDAVEADPGFFMAVGSARKTLSLRLQPSDPNTALPSSFWTEWNQGPTPPPPYWTEVSLTEGNCVSFYPQAEDGDPLTSLRWGWREVGFEQFTHTATPTQLYVQAIAAGTCTIDLNLTYRPHDKCWPEEITGTYDKVKVTVLDLLTAWDLDGQVPEDKEENPGAFVHYNVDNDNSSNNVPGAPKHPGWDCAEEAGPVSGEDDLKLLKMCVGQTPTQGVMTLSRNQTAVRVWKSATKGADNEILVADNTEQWDLSEAQQRADFIAVKDGLYVEGYGSGTATLTLAYAPPGGQAAISDQVKYTFIAADCGDQPRTESVQTKVWRWYPLPGTWVVYGGRVQKSHIGTPLPALVGCEWSVTAQLDQHDNYHWALKEYNCMAWSVDDDQHYYDQRAIDGYGNGNGIFEDYDVDEFFKKKKGWYPIQEGTLQEKAAQAEVMYYRYAQPWNFAAGDPKPTGGFHAARRKSGCNCGAGRWIMYDSKLGQWERIEHVWDQLNGEMYGPPERLRFYK